MGRALVTTLKKNGTFDEYNKVIESYKDEGYIKEIPEDQVLHAWSHFPVHRQASRTTKIRPVFSAIELNSHIYKGRIRTKDGKASLGIFRMFECFSLADIRRAFLQLSLKDTERTPASSGMRSSTPGRLCAWVSSNRQQPWKKQC